MSDFNIGGLDLRNLATTRYTQRPRPLGVLQKVGLDDLEHDFTCDFIREDGILPCTCRPEHARRSIWYNTWKGWLRVRVSPSWWVYHIVPPSWPSP